MCITYVQMAVQVSSDEIIAQIDAIVIDGGEMSFDEEESYVQMAVQVSSEEILAQIDAIVIDGETEMSLDEGTD